MVSCNDPVDAKETIFTLSVDANPPGLALNAMSPIMQYTRNPKGLLFAYTWNVFGAFESALLDDGPELSFGQSSHAMRATIKGLLDGVPAAGMQTFVTPPVATSTRGYLVQPEQRSAATTSGTQAAIEDMLGKLRNPKQFSVLQKCDPDDLKNLKNFVQRFTLNTSE